MTIEVTYEVGGEIKTIFARATGQDEAFRAEQVLRKQVANEGGHVISVEYRS